MATSTTPALGAADAVYAAEQAIGRARRTLDDLHGTGTSAIGHLGEVELELARARLTGRGDFYLEVAVGLMGCLRAPWKALSELSAELVAHLALAATAARNATELVATVGTTDPRVRAEVAQLRPRVAVLDEMVELARRLAQTATHHVVDAHRASLDVTPPALLEPKTLERSIQSPVTPGVAVGTRGGLEGRRYVLQGSHHAGAHRWVFPARDRLDILGQNLQGDPGEGLVAGSRVVSGGRGVGYVKTHARPGHGDVARAGAMPPRRPSTGGGVPQAIPRTRGQMENRAGRSDEETPIAATLGSTPPNDVPELPPSAARALLALLEDAAARSRRDRAEQETRSAS
jgi:hypothetical protein